MATATVVHRYGRRLEPHDDVVPDGATVRVALPVADVLSARTARVFARDGADRPLVLDLLGQPAGFRPGFALARDDFAATTSNQTSQSASEVAREDYVRCVSACCGPPGRRRVPLPLALVALRQAA
jgi:hypothetical protein